MSTLQAILFDWGGTLASVRREDMVWRDCSRAAAVALHELGVTPSQADASELQEAFLATREQAMTDPQFRELPFRTFMQQWLLERTGTQVPDELTATAENAFWNTWTTCLDALDRSAELLAEFKQSGLLLGLVSNVIAPAKYCQLQLERLGLLEHLSTLTFSSEVGWRKPHPAMYHDALSQLQKTLGPEQLHPEQVLFVGDSPTCDVAGPAKLGMRTAWITHPDVVAPPPAGGCDDIKPTHHIQHLDELSPFLAHATASSL